MIVGSTTSEQLHLSLAVRVCANSYTASRMYNGNVANPEVRNLHDRLALPVAVPKSGHQDITKRDQEPGQPFQNQQAPAYQIWEVDVL